MHKDSFALIETIIITFQIYYFFLTNTITPNFYPQSVIFLFFF